MRLGVVFPQLEIGTDPAVIRDFAQTAEGLGYERIVVYDHVLGADPDRPPGSWRGPRSLDAMPYTHESTFHEPFVLFGFLACCTERLELMTGVLILPQRQTALVAKQVAEADILSGGRVVLGVGVGWNPVEFEALGEDFSNRGRRQEEQIELLRRLWSEPVVTYEGRYHRVTKAGLNPLPGRRIPIWIGCEVDRALERTGRLADGWLVPGTWRADPSLIAEPLAKIHAAADAAGRDPSDLGIAMNFAIGSRSVAEQVEAVRGWADAGASHLAINTMGAGFASPAKHIEAIGAFAEAYGLSS